MRKEIATDKKIGEMVRIGCAKCQIPTHHKVILSVDENFDWDNEYFANESFQIVQCQGCDAFSFRHESSNSEDIDEDGTVIQSNVYPERHRKNPALPDANFLPYKVQRIYEETHRALKHDQPILSGIGIRALVEAVCVDRKATGTLRQMIDKLVQSSDLKQSEAEILHKLRFMGNHAAHEITAPSDESLSLAFDIVEHLLVNVYLLERRAANLPDR